MASAAAVAGSEDLLTEILIRLPGKSLLRFKSVCTQWYSLISNPCFSLLLLRTSVSGLFISLDFSGRRLPGYEYKYVDFCGKKTRSKLDMRIRDSCNGLMLCSCVPSPSSNAFNKYYIYNPTTKQSVSIPPPDVSSVLKAVCFNLAFDPCKSAHCKIVLTFCYRSLCQIGIYSTQTKNWKQLPHSFSAIFLSPSFKGVYLNGSIHWLSELDTSLRLDVDGESLSTMTMPPVQDSSRKIGYFGESGGRLHLIELRREILVFEMERDYSKWVLKYSVDFNSMKTRYSLLDVVVSGEREDESKLTLYVSGKIVCYNFTNKNIKEVCDLKVDTNDDDNLLRDGWLNAYRYSQTLFYINE